jgi:hypothetical protein
MVCLHAPRQGGVLYGTDLGIATNAKSERSRAFSVFDVCDTNSGIFALQSGRTLSKKENWNFVLSIDMGVLWLTRKMDRLDKIIMGALRKICSGKAPNRGALRERIFIEVLFLEISTFENRQKGHGTI